MEHRFESVPMCFSLDLRDTSELMAVGFIDGQMDVCTFDGSECDIKVKWSYKLKQSVRGIQLNTSSDLLYTISENKALCMFDVNTGSRTRCIIKSHDDKPNCICLLPSSASNGQQFATADESGEIKTWDFRVKNPEICKFRDQEDVINTLCTERNMLLSASSDGTLAAYEVRGRKLFARSEAMHAELHSIVANTKYVYVGSGDGHIEVFSNGYYGNLVDRIESGHVSVDCMLQLRKGLIITASAQEADMRLLHVDPNKQLVKAGSHCKSGVDNLYLTADEKFIVSHSILDQSIKVLDAEMLRSKVPVLAASKIKDGMQKVKSKTKNDGFFDGLVESDEDDDQSTKGDESEADQSGEEDEDDSMDEDEGDSEGGGESEDEEEEDSDDE